MSSRASPDQVGGMAKRNWLRKRRIETRIEVEQVIIVRRRKNIAALTCEECAGVLLLTPEEAAAIHNLSTRTIYRWVEAGFIHSLETPDRLLLVCPASLM